LKNKEQNIVEEIDRLSDFGGEVLNVN